MKPIESLPSFSGERSNEIEACLAALTKENPMEEINEICRQEAENNGDDIDAAVDIALARVKKLPNFKTFVKQLLTDAIRSRVHDARHKMNVQIRRENGGYVPTSSIAPGPAVSDVVSSVYAYMIAGRTLGSILGEELEDIAASEAARANGHMFNAKLAEKLRPLVKKEKTVSQCVSESRLKKIFESIQK